MADVDWENKLWYLPLPSFYTGVMAMDKQKVQLK